MKWDTETKVALGRHIQELRKSRNLTQESLASVAELSARSVRRAERGHGISFESLSCLAGAFGLDAHELLRRTNET